MADKKVPVYSGIPSVVDPDTAKWLKANHPRYESYAPIITQRLTDWQAENDPESDAYKAARKAEADAEAAADAAKAKEAKKTEGESSPKTEVKEGK